MEGGDFGLSGESVEPEFLDDVSLETEHDLLSYLRCIELSEKEESLPGFFDRVVCVYVTFEYVAEVGAK